jgi:hypothetical protein
MPDLALPKLGLGVTFFIGQGIPRFEIAHCGIDALHVSNPVERVIHQVREVI